MNHYYLKYFFIFLWCLCVHPIRAQQDVLEAFDMRMVQLKKDHGRVLASWAGVNIVSSGILAFTTNHQSAYFHAMNASWGLVNTGIAAFIYYHHNTALQQPQTLLQQMDHQRHVEKMMLLNIGLDIAYMAGGLALYQYGNGNRISYPELWKGFGASIMVQSAFLLIQDYVFYRLHLNNRKKVYPVWQRLLKQR